MIYALFLLGVTFLGWTGHPDHAALALLLAHANWHMLQESSPSYPLARAFAQRTGAKWLTKVDPWLSWLAVPAPAWALQLYAAKTAFAGPVIVPWALALSLGLQLGDAFFSHLKPAIEDHDPKNPGLTTALLYVLTPLVFGLMYFHTLHFSGDKGFLAFMAGILFFALVQPVLSLTAPILNRIFKA